MSETQYYCDKCESEKVEVREIREPRQVERKPMSSMPHPNEPSVIPAVMKIKQYEAHCKECGHTVPLHYTEIARTFYGNSISS